MVKGISGMINTGTGTSGIKTEGTKNGRFKLQLERSRMNEKGVVDKTGTEKNKLNGIREIAPDGVALNKEVVLRNIFKNLDAGHKRIEGILKVSLSGVKLSQQELLTLQMRVYRFTQEVELISKLVEKGTSGVKQVVNTQV